MKSESYIMLIQPDCKPKCIFTKQSTARGNEGDWMESAESQEASDRGGS